MDADRDEPRHEPTREQVDGMTGPVVLEFGAGWCGHCKRLAPVLDALLDDHPAVLHVKVEDGPGRPLGRSFRVKLWPTLVFLRDGEVLARAVRPAAGEVRAGLEAIDPATGAEPHA